MRLDRIGPRTWLLATCAGWALAAWLLALAGLGAHARILADDPGMLQPLPRVPEALAQRLGPPGTYAAASNRPLFASDRRPHPFALEAPDDAAAAKGGFDYILTSVLIAPPLRMAIVQPAEGGDGIPVRLGESADEIPGWRLVELAPRSAVFEGPEGRKSLPLRTWDGVGGEAASHATRPAGARSTAMSAADAEQAAQAADAAAAAAPPPAPTQVANQMEAIRKRIEARRAQMRREAAESTAPDRNP